MALQELRYLVVHAAGLPLAAVGLVATASSLRAFGPAFFSSYPLTLLPLGFGAAWLILHSIGTIAPPSGSWASVVPIFASFFVLFIALAPAYQAVEKYAFHVRGLTASCQVLDVDRRVETHTNSEGHTGYTVRYDHRLGCSEARVREMTTAGRPAGEAGDQIEVAFDPSGRLDPRPAGAAAGDYQSKLRTTGVLLAAGIALNLAARLEVGIRPIDRVVVGVNDRYRSWRHAMGRRGRARRSRPDHGDGGR